MFVKLYRYDTKTAEHFDPDKMVQESEPKMYETMSLVNPDTEIGFICSAPFECDGRKYHHISFHGAVPDQSYISEEDYQKIIKRK